MKNLAVSADRAVIDRRTLLKTGAAAMATLLGAGRASAQSEQAVPWWAVRRGKDGSAGHSCIDVHAHWSPEAFNKALSELGHPLREPYVLNVDLDKRRKWMDEHGVQMHVLTLIGNVIPWQWVSAEDGERLAQVVNDATIEAHVAFPGRFLGAVAMPVRDPKLALRELNRVAGKPGMRAVNLPDSIFSRDYVFEPEFAPVLARIEELGYPILFHQMGGDANRVVNRPVAVGLDETFQHAVEATKFITTGTLDQYPKLEIVLPHAGGAFPYIAGRMEHFLYHMPNTEKNQQPRPFREYIRRFHYDYLTYYPEAFRFLVSLVGSDRIMVGTDEFAARDIDYPCAVVEQMNLPPADRDRILRGNAVRLLHL